MDFHTDIWELIHQMSPGICIKGFVFLGVCLWKLDAWWVVAGAEFIPTGSWGFPKISIYLSWAQWQLLLCFQYFCFPSIATTWWMSTSWGLPWPNVKTSAPLELQYCGSGLNLVIVEYAVRGCLNVLLALEQHSAADGFWIAELKKFSARLVMHCKKRCWLTLPSLTVDLVVLQLLDLPSRETT